MKVFHTDGHVVSQLRSGSVLIVTVLADPRVEGSGKDLLERRLAQLEQRVTRGRVPRGIRGKDLSKWGLAKVCRTIANDEIRKTLNDRNGVLRKEHKLSYSQLFNFHYADGTKMLTVGGVIVNDRDKVRLEPNPWEDLRFVRHGEEPFQIEVPVLTMRETTHLDQVLSENRSLAREASWLPKEDCERYKQIYRYSPTYVETEL